MSALPLMRRTAFMAVALALLTTAGMLSAQTAQTAKAERKPATARTWRASHSASAGPIAAAHAKGCTNSNAKFRARRTRRTAYEVGREAGLEILRQRAGMHLAPRRTLRLERRRSGRWPRIERAAWRSAPTRQARAAERSKGGPGVSNPGVWHAETVGTRAKDTQRVDGGREAMQASDAGEANEAGESADVGPADDDRGAPDEPTSGKKNDAVAQDGDETQATALSETSKAPGSAGAKTEDDEASLLMPRGGMPAPLRGSLASLERQNDRLDEEGLERIENEADLAARIAKKLLVPLPVSSALTVNAELEVNHRYCRPWTAKFLTDLARAHEAAFQKPLEVSSAVRTVEYQKRLMETNGNAAPAEGDLVSPHLTGATIDIAKKGLSRAEVAWMRKRLLDLEAAGKIDVEEEFKQACFHITVYKSYVRGATTGPATPTKPAADRTRRPAWAAAIEAQGA